MDLKNRAPNEALIRALMTCGNDEGVCEMCAGSWPRNELTTVWIGQGNQEEGIDLCRDCKTQGGEQ